MLAAIQPEASSHALEGACMVAFISAGLAALAWQNIRARRAAPMGAGTWKADWVDFGIWFAAIYCAAYIGISLFKLGFGDRGTDPNDQTGFILRAAAMHAATLTAQLALLWKWRSWSPWPVNAARLSVKQIIQEAGLAWLAAYPLVAATSLTWDGVLYMAQKQNAPPQQAVQLLGHVSAGQAVVMFVFAGLVAPINEELFFRAGLYRFFKSRLPKGFALVAVNLLFAAAHANLLSFLPLFVLGILLTRLYERCGNIAAPMLFHALFNLANMALILLFPDSASPLNPS